MSVFSNTTKPRNKIIGEIDTYNLTNKSDFDLNKTVDMIIQKNSISKFKNDLATYGQFKPDRHLPKKDTLVKQKPAAPEIKRKVNNQLNIISPSFSDTNMIQYSNVSSVKSFVRPKSMDRLKRKPTLKKKQAKSKPRKKITKRRTKKDEFSTFDHTGSLIVTKASNALTKSFTRDRSFDRVKPTTGQASRKSKLDYELKKICKIKPNKSRDSRNFRQTKLHNQSAFTKNPQRSEFFDKKIPGKYKHTDTQILNMITGLNQDSIMLNTGLKLDSKRSNQSKSKKSKPHPKEVKKSKVVQSSKKPTEKLEVYSNVKSKKIEEPQSSKEKQNDPKIFDDQSVSANQIRTNFSIEEYSNTSENPQ